MMSHGDNKYPFIGDLRAQHNFPKLVHVVTPSILQEVLQRVVGAHEMRLLPPVASKLDLGLGFPEVPGHGPPVCFHGGLIAIFYPHSRQSVSPHVRSIAGSPLETPALPAWLLVRAGHYTSIVWYTSQHIIQL